MRALLRRWWMKVVALVSFVAGAITGQAADGTSDALSCQPTLVGASVFSGSLGYRGDNLNRQPSYAELGMGRHLGHLPRGFRLRIGYYDRVLVGKKLDIGLGGGPVGGYRRDIDLHWESLAKQLRFPWGIGLVRVQPASCVRPVGGSLAARAAL